MEDQYGSNDFVPPGALPFTESAIPQPTSTKNSKKRAASSSDEDQNSPHHRRRVKKSRDVIDLNSANSAASRSEKRPVYEDDLSVDAPIDKKSGSRRGTT